MRHLVWIGLLLSGAVLAREPLRTPRMSKLFLQTLDRDDVDRALGLFEAKEKIRTRSGWLEGTGKDLGTSRNNLAVTLILQQDMQRAREELKITVANAPQLFPARYNLGRIYLFYKDHHHALLEFKKARALVPQYWKNYYFLGKTYELQGDYNSADHHYRQAYRKNPYDLSSLVALGDLLIQRRRLSEARDVFRHCLKQDDGFNDALIGMGKVAYEFRDYYDATVWFRAVATHRDYKKELHYYYAEAAFFAQDYRMAVGQYRKMLAFPTDAIYDRISLTRVRARLKQSQRLALEKQAAE